MLKEITRPAAPRVVRLSRLQSGDAGPSVRINATAANFERLREVTQDWLFSECGPEGRERLLRDHGIAA